MVEILIQVYTADLVQRSALTVGTAYGTVHSHITNTDNHVLIISVQILTTVYSCLELVPSYKVCTVIYMLYY